MTVTQTNAAPATAAAPALSPAPAPRGLAGILGTADHRSVGRLWIATSFLFLLVAGVAGGAVGVEKIDLDGIDVLDTDVFGQVYSLHAVAGVFLFLAPLLLGLAISIVPGQVGSATLAFPRAAAAAYWTYLVSGGTVIGAYIANGGPFGGEEEAVDLFVVAMIGVVLALCLAALCVGTTAISLRTAGMSLRRVPLFTWSALTASVVWLLTLPVLAGVLVLVYLDHRYGRTFLGGNQQVYVRMAWVWSQPSVYALAIPALGIIGDVVPVAARTRFRQHRIALFAIGAFSALSFGAWAMPGFTAANTEALPLSFVDEAPFIGYSFLIVLPVLVLAGLAADTLRRGTTRVTSPLLFAAAALLMLLAGIANGALVSIDALDLVGTTAQPAQTHYVLLAATIAALGGIVHWAPRLFGTAVSEGPARGIALLALVGTVLLCLPDVITGLLDQAARLNVSDVDDVDSIEALNLVSAIGGGLLVLVALGFVGLVLQAVRAADGEDDPWPGHTLEWAGETPVAVRSEAPLYDARYAPEAAS